jgi:hypothetical protein
VLFYPENRVSQFVNNWGSSLLLPLPLFIVLEVKFKEILGIALGRGILLVILDTYSYDWKKRVSYW